MISEQFICLVFGFAFIVFGINFINKYGYLLLGISSYMLGTLLICTLMKIVYVYLIELLRLDAIYQYQNHFVLIVFGIYLSVLIYLIKHRETKFKLNA